MSLLIDTEFKLEIIHKRRFEYSPVRDESESTVVLDDTYIEQKLRKFIPESLGDHNCERGRERAPALERGQLAISIFTTEPMLT